MSNVTVQQKDEVTGKVVEQKSKNGAAHVHVSNITSIPSGTLIPHAMIPKDATVVIANATEVWTSAIGCKAFYVQEQDAIPATQVLLVAASTLENQGAALSLILNAVNTEAVTATGANAGGGVLKLQAHDILRIAPVYDGTTTIKTVAMRWASTTAAVVVETLIMTLNTIED